MSVCDTEGNWHTTRIYTGTPEENSINPDVNYSAESDWAIYTMSDIVFKCNVDTDVKKKYEQYVDSIVRSSLHGTSKPGS